jgi:hypothetical protein
VSASAAELDGLEVSRSEGRIYVHSELTINAPLPVVYDALIDYDRFSELSKRYQESYFVAPAVDGTRRIYTSIKGCVWFFCRTVNRYARLEVVPPTTIKAIAEPEESDVSFGVETWVLTKRGQTTRVVYDHEMEPDFWVPPLLGVWAIRRTLKRDALAAAERIETLALGDGEIVSDNN